MSCDLHQMRQNVYLSHHAGCTVKKRPPPLSQLLAGNTLRQMEPPYVNGMVAMNTPADPARLNVNLGGDNKKTPKNQLAQKFARGRSLAPAFGGLPLFNKGANKSHQRHIASSHNKKRENQHPEAILAWVANSCHVTSTR